MHRCGYRPWYVHMLRDFVDARKTLILENGKVYHAVQGSRGLRAVNGETEVPIYAGEYAVLAWTLLEEHPIWRGR